MGGLIWWLLRLPFKLAWLPFKWFGFHNVVLGALIAVFLHGLWLYAAA